MEWKGIDFKHPISVVWTPFCIVLGCNDDGNGVRRKLSVMIARQWSFVLRMGDGSGDDRDRDGLWVWVGEWVGVSQDGWCNDGCGGQWLTRGCLKEFRI